ncbi:hypothetical protein CCACVL1_20490 [Corchorus capsularis]|uniref:Uncharacterized protein n=1 Tax=Corchorus capsularis TaxID=210143 RepID=A0A1R3HAX4_COCAP|nr:hypothetical protein CCACVL1_20490 [Corchorus capsularis]
MIQLPQHDPKSSMKARYIGSCMGRLQFAHSDSDSTLRIWALSLDEPEWIFRHSINLETLANHPRLLALRNKIDPEIRPRTSFFPEAFDPHNDVVIIWTVNCIFAYHCNSGNVVVLRRGNGRKDGRVIDPPSRSFPFTRCLVSLANWGGQTLDKPSLSD